MLVSNKLKNKSFFCKIHPSVKFLLFIFSVVMFFLPGGFFSQMILLSVFIPIFFIARLGKKTYINVLKTILLVLFFFLLINWITNKDPITFYNSNKFIFFGGNVNDLFVKQKIGDNKLFISEIYGGNIFQINNEIIKNFKNSETLMKDMKSWFNQFSSSFQNDIINKVYTGDDANVILDAKVFLYILNNNFHLDGINYKSKVILDSVDILNGIAYSPNSSVLYSNAWYSISPIAFFNSIYISNKILLILICSNILVETTTSIELTNGLERVLRPLKIFKFPAAECAMILSIGIRFIPTLIAESQRILNAQASRGLDFYNGNFLIKIKALLALIVPLFSISIRRSDELANAMEARGYNPKSIRTNYHNFKFGAIDFILIACVAFLFTLTLTLGVTNLVFVPFGIIEMGLIS